MDDFFLIDKPQGITSFDVLRDMRKKLQIKKMGHTGTLDPLATGCLLVATGRYTKLIPYFEKDTKEYECDIYLDGVSDSYDVDTPIQYISEEQKKLFQESITLENIQHLLEKDFTGEISQIPPIYSALKIDGKKSVDLVRQGKKPELKERKVIIYNIEILDFSYPKLTLRTRVSAGTYIRSLAYDIGQKLGTGGYISRLRRTSIGNINISDSISLEQVSGENKLQESKLFPSDMFFSLSSFEIIERLKNGQRVKVELDFPESREVFLVYNSKINFVVEYKNGVLHPIKYILS